MRSSVIAALCAAPLALAGNIQQDLAVRGVVTPELVPRSNIEVIQGQGTDVIVIWTNNGGGAATNTVTQTKTVTQLSAATGAVAAATTHTVVVGGTAGLVYTPDSIQAAIGDMVIFQFMSQNHTVTQSAFTTPCEKLATGMDSGFVANINNTISPAPQVAMQVLVDTPQWFYCRQAGHCGKGMTFSINPTANKTQAMFQSMAIAQNGTGTATAITGGTAAGAGSAQGSGSALATTASGNGQTNADGTCTCSCLCGAAAFPVAAQGIGMFGGMSGSMPVALLET